MKFTSEELEVIKAAKSQPAVSLIISCTPAIALKTEMAHKLKLARNEAGRQLTASYGEVTGNGVLKKLDEVIDTLKPEDFKKSIAIFVSPVMAKVFYFDIQLEDKIIIDESFEIRDLVYAKQAALTYLVLLITGRHAKVFLSENGQMIRLKLDMPENIEAYENDIAEQVFNFTDPAKRKEQIQEKFLRHIDAALSELLQAHPLPVFVTGVDRLTGHFNQLTANAKSIVDIVQGNYSAATVPEINVVLKPYTDAWQANRNLALLNEIEKAMNAGQLEAGIKAVWKAATEKNGRLLIVEKNYMYPAERTSDEKYIRQPETTAYMKDAVDDVIEMVIQNGGEVRFVEKGMLEEYLNIVLIRFY